MIGGELRAAAERIRTRAVERDPALAGLPLAGIGWATVEHERAQSELDPSGSWAELARDPALGARRWLRVADGATADPALVILEPDTEGRLAASLARFGETVAVAYLGNRAIAEGRLVREGPAWGPHVVVAANAGAR